RGGSRLTRAGSRNRGAARGPPRRSPPVSLLRARVWWVKPSVGSGDTRVDPIPRLTDTFRPRDRRPRSRLPRRAGRPAGRPGRAMLELYGLPPPRPSLQAPAARIGILDQIGRETLGMLSENHGLDFIGDVAVAGAKAARAPGSVNWGDVPRLMERAGADGLPIVLVINFLVGLVTAFQAAVQVKQFGANIFVADLVGLSVTRELAPLMTAIIVAGRSGAAFSAELGTMRVSEEIVALRALAC